MHLSWVRYFEDHNRARLNLRPTSPNEGAIVRLVGAILLEQNDQGAVQRSRDLSL